MRFFVKKTAFTFVETLVVVALFAITSVILFSSFSAGMKVWKRAAMFNQGERKIMITMERISRELRQAVNDSTIGFWGANESLNFANVGRDKIWNISYFYNAGEQNVGRSAIARSLIPALEEEKSRILVSGAAGCSFGYYGYNNETDDFSFWESWNYTQSGIPKAVKVSLTSKEGNLFEKIITIPTAE